MYLRCRTRKFTNGNHLRDMVQHLPKRFYYRRASYKPDGRRKDYWVLLVAPRFIIWGCHDRTVEKRVTMGRRGQDHRDQSDRGERRRGAQYIRVEMGC